MVAVANVTIARMGGIVFGRKCRFSTQVTLFHLQYSSQEPAFCLLLIYSHIQKEKVYVLL